MADFTNTVIWNTNMCDDLKTLLRSSPAFPHSLIRYISAKIMVAYESSNYKINLKNVF